MELIRFTKVNIDFMKNLPSNIQSELIVLEDVIPDGILRPLFFHDPFFNKERRSFLNYRPDILKKMYQVRNDRERLAEKENIINLWTDENIEFIKKYPQYKQLISGIIFRDENRATVKVVPIDQYLAEN